MERCFRSTRRRATVMGRASPPGRRGPPRVLWVLVFMRRLVFSALLAIAAATTALSCATMTPAQCRAACRQRGMVMKGYATEQTQVPNPYAKRDSCICGEPEPARPTAPSGCSKDTDCKGERICVNGSCEDPPAEAPTTEVSPSPPSR